MFNYDALRWNKIIICTDADEDGFQIRTLLLTLFYQLLPTLIEKGKVFIEVDKRSADYAKSAYSNVIALKSACEYAPEINKWWLALA